jgi:predicted amidophosphoribosyltransferase
MNSLESGRLRREHRTMQCMVEIYCAAHHAAGHGRVCSDCGDFLTYAGRRLERCPYGSSKPTCAQCPVHCYKPAPRDLAARIMRYSGPRMALMHPWLSLLHFVDKARRVEHPMTRRRRDGA